MIDVLDSGGFLGTPASLAADVSLVATLLAAMLLTIGWRLAVRKRFAAHRWLQTIATGLNAVVVIAWMARSFVLYVLPGLPANLGDGSYALTTIHAVTATIGLLLGVFIILRCSELVPSRLRFADYKLYMRTSYALYLLSTLLGVLVYLAIYGRG